MKLKGESLILFSILVLIMSLPAGASFAQSRLLALSKTDHTLAIVDPATLKVLGKVPVGIDPHEVIAAADGKPLMFQSMAEAACTSWM